MTTPSPVAVRRVPRHRRLEDASDAGLPEVCHATVASHGGATGGALLDVPDPATGEPLLRVEDAGPQTAAVAASTTARVARGDWAWLAQEDRARWLYVLAAELEARARPVGLTSALVSGRPVAAALHADAARLVDAAFSAAGWADKLPAVGLGARRGGAVVLRSSWRTPPAALAAAVTGALGVGLGVVLRPTPEAAPLALLLAGAVRTAGLPADLVSVVPGTAPGADKALLTHEDVLAAHADGGAEELRELAVALAELGRPLHQRADATGVDVVLDGADVEDVAEALLDTVRGGAPARPGGSRVLVVAALADRLTERLQEGLAALRVGHPLDRATDVGPCPAADVHHRARALRGRRAALPDDLPAGGWWVLPTLVPLGRRAPVPPAGPVLGVRVVTGDDDVAPLLAGTTHLAVWGGDARRALRVLGAAAPRAVGLGGPAADDDAADALRLLRAVSS
ncbi:aldehyde dehydrogenase family protein [Kineococcus sp. SYSU DK004]|uniref:aldehyde dehydrogenase family protein n=1 Tax=Kineococcus sp. SYSU DK004 TaxID=3383125 RepID=UPI003D7DD205